MGKDHVGVLKATVSANYVFKIGGEVVCIDQLEAELAFDYSRTCEVLAEAMRLVMSSSTQFNSTSMRDIGVYVELLPVDEKQVVIKLSDTKNKLNNRAFVYRFAVYYP